MTTPIRPVRSPATRIARTVTPSAAKPRRAPGPSRRARPRRSACPRTDPPEPPSGRRRGTALAQQHPSGDVAAVLDVVVGRDDDVEHEVADDDDRGPIGHATPRARRAILRGREAGIAVEHTSGDACRPGRSGGGPPVAVVNRRTTNSAGRSGAKATSMIARPWSMSSWVIVLPRPQCTSHASCGRVPGARPGARAGS